MDNPPDSVPSDAHIVLCTGAGQVVQAHSRDGHECDHQQEVV